MERQRVVTESDAAHPTGVTEPAAVGMARRTRPDTEGLSEPLLLRSWLSFRLVRRSRGRSLTGSDSLEGRVRRDRTAGASAALHDLDMPVPVRHGKVVSEPRMSTSSGIGRPCSQAAAATASLRRRVETTCREPLGRQDSRATERTMAELGILVPPRR